MDGEPVCRACLKKRPDYSVAWAPFVYEGAAAEAIKQLKYEKKTFLAPLLANLMVPLAERKVSDLERPLVMPVPLHPRRLRERGYNQSLLLARALANKLKLELDYLSLRKLRHTSPQMSLDMDRRHTNVRGAFKVKDQSRCGGRDILLIDDVATTGTTLNECAMALMEAGAKAVACLTFAKAAL
jgi:ComF family protein